MSTVAKADQGLTLRARVAQLEKAVRQCIGMAEDASLTCQRFLEPLRACVEKSERELCHVLDELDAFPQPASNRIDRLRERVRAFCTKPMASVSGDVGVVEGEDDGRTRDQQHAHVPLSALSGQGDEAAGATVCNALRASDAQPDQARLEAPVETPRPSEALTEEQHDEPAHWLKDEVLQALVDTFAASKPRFERNGCRLRDMAAEILRLRVPRTNEAKATPITFEVDMGARSNELTVAEESARGRAAWFAGGPGATFNRSEEQRSNEAVIEPVVPTMDRLEALVSDPESAGWSEVEWMAREHLRSRQRTGQAVACVSKSCPTYECFCDPRATIPLCKKCGALVAGDRPYPWRVLVNDEGEPYAVDNGTFRREVDTDGNVAPRSDYPCTNADCTRIIVDLKEEVRALRDQRSETPMIYKAETGDRGEKLASVDDGREVKRREAQPAEASGSSRSPSASSATSLCSEPAVGGPCTRDKGHLSPGHWHVGEGFEEAHQADVERARAWFAEHADGEGPSYGDLASLIGEVRAEGAADAHGLLARGVELFGTDDERIETLKSMLRKLLASASPSMVHHPTMHAAWREAEALLGIPREKSNAIPCADEENQP